MLKLHFFKSPLSIDENVTLADLLAIEADFDSYTPGGYPVVGTPQPGAGPAPPYVEYSFVNVNCVTAAVTNTLYGWWIDNGGLLVIAGNFDVPIPMAKPGAGIALQVIDSYAPGVPALLLRP